MTCPRSAPATCCPPPPPPPPLSRLSLPAYSSKGGGAGQQVDYPGDQIGVPSTLGFPQGASHLVPHLPLSFSPRPTPKPWLHWIRMWPPFFPRGPRRRRSQSPPLVSMDGFLSSRNHLRGGDQLGPVSSQQVHERPSLPEGDSAFFGGLCPPRTLGDVHRPFGCLLSRPHSPSQTDVAPFCVEEQGFPVSSPPFWSGPCSQDFYLGSQGAVHLLCQRGVCLKVYLHDWLILASSADLCHRHTQTVLELCMRLGVHLSSIKSELSTVQQFTFLDMLFDTVHWLVWLAHHWVQWLGLCIAQRLHCPSAPASLLATLQGLMESLAPPIPHSCFHKHALQTAFWPRWSHTHQSWDALVPISPWFLQAVAHWLDLSWVSQRVPISVPPPQEELFTDHPTRVGAYTGRAGVWPQVLSSFHINQLELEAVFLAL